MRLPGAREGGAGTEAGKKLQQQGHLAAPPAGFWSGTYKCFVFRTKVDPIKNAKRGRTFSWKPPTLILVLHLSFRFMALDVALVGCGD